MTLDLAWQDGGWSGFVPWIEVVHVYDQGSRDRIRLFLLCLNLLTCHYRTITPKVA